LQDAINKAIERPKQGCRILMEPGGGYAFVATGQATYKSESVTVTAGRIAQRNAYIEAFMQAKAEMAQTVGEIVVRGTTDFSKRIETLDTDTKELRNIETDLSEEQLQTVRKVLKGYVTYSVETGRITCT
jgi:head-tail adaptor